jgi:hypothetical protein
LSKVIEKVAAHQLVTYISAHDMSGKWQSAYKAHHSIETALTRVFNDVLVSLDRKQCCALIMLDLSSAFDTVDHQKLINRLFAYYGVKGKVLNWIESYLSGRKQIVKVNSSSSDSKDVKCGVPQGSIMGPLLFTLYVAPLSDIIAKFGFNFHFYADDSQVYFSFNPKEKGTLEFLLNKLNDCIMEVHKWLGDNYLKMNNEKTDVILLGSPHFIKYINLDYINICNTSIRVSTSVRNLGAIMDKSLTMLDHINNLCRNCYFQIKKIWRIRYSLNHQATKTIVHALIMSCLDLLNILLIGLPKKYINKLQKVQNSAACLCFSNQHIQLHCYIHYIGSLSKPELNLKLSL